MIVVCGVVLSVILWIKDGMETEIVENQIAEVHMGMVQSRSPWSQRMERSIMRFQ